jgi:anti-sigma-K factor RskA
MATYKDPQLRDKLAAEYVLGTLRGRARARFQSLLRYDIDLRRTVGEWELRLTPIAAAAGEIEPPARLWKKIAARIGAASASGGWRASLALWRTLAAASTTAVLALGIYLGAAPKPEPPVAMVAVMSDEQARPAMVVSWPPLKDVREPHIRVRIIQDHPAMPANTSWELWMLPGGKAAPVSLGLVGLETTQVVRLKPELAKMIWQAWGVALSVEPAGGSPTGAPTGPVIFKGQCVKVL